MKQTRVIDADGHILEPRALWTERMEPRFKVAAPRIERHDDGRELLLIEGRPASELPVSSLGSAGLGVVDDYDAPLRSRSLCPVPWRPRTACRGPRLKRWECRVHDWIV